MKHCQTCACERHGLIKETHKIMSEHHVICPTCGEVATPSLIIDGGCSMCRCNDKRWIAKGGFYVP